MTLTIGLELLSALIILTGVIRIIRNTPDILTPRRMEPSRWRHFLVSLAIVWTGTVVLNLAFWIPFGLTTTWLDAARIIVTIYAGVTLGRELWNTHKPSPTQP